MKYADLIQRHKLFQKNLFASPKATIVCNPTKYRKTKKSDFSENGKLTSFAPINLDSQTRQMEELQNEMEVMAGFFEGFLTPFGISRIRMPRLEKRLLENNIWIGLNSQEFALNLHLSTNNFATRHDCKRICHNTSDWLGDEAGNGAPYSIRLRFLWDRKRCVRYF